MTDRLDEIEEVEGYLPKLLVNEADGSGRSASVHEEADGLEALCTVPSYFSAEAQNLIAHALVNMRDNHTALLGAVRATLALHQSDGGHNPLCECGIEAGDGARCLYDSERWPCPTVAAINEALEGKV
jgi:hypothetical protein